MLGRMVELAGAAWPQFVRPLVLETFARRPIREILPGIWHWTTVHPRIRVPVDSYYVEPAGIVLDPCLPREGLEWFSGRADLPRAVVLTNRHHLRHSERFAEAFGCPIRCSEPGLHEFAGGGPVVEPFAFGDEIAPGVVAHEVGAICPDDTALLITVDGAAPALAFADGVQHPRGGGLTFVPGLLMGDDPATVRAELRDSLRGLLDLDFDSLLFAHGDPIVGGGKQALRDFLSAGA